ncbi:protein of unknown function [Hyphomicrobium sp. 1Nfss2.1]|uniref:hypothetical protein n=1 Tax=Hyphomicrobium sp. 1Nfss2.1 TaxID=3413936 RepID=UPI003C7CB355
MATRTQADLASAVMEDLALINTGDGEDPSAADRAMITRRYQNMLAEMRDENIVYWSDDAIPYEAFEAVVGLMSLIVGPSFGKPKLAEGEDFNNALDGAKRRLRKRVVKPASGLPVGADDSYF